MTHQLSEKDSIIAQEDLIIDFQFAIQDRLVKAKITRAELSSRCGLGVRKLSNLLGAGGNPTVREVALIFAALNQVVKIRTCAVKPSQDEPSK